MIPLEVYNIDCLELDTSPVDLLYLDPPYSYIGEDDYYGVGKNLPEYLDYMQIRLTHLKTLLNSNANLIIHIDHKMVHYIKVMSDEIFGRKNFKNEIIWCFTGPANTARWFPRKHQTLLWYGFGNYSFNQPRIAYASNLSVGGKTSWAKKKLNPTEYLKRGKALEDYWTDIPALVRNEKEKLGYPTQKPVKLFERVLTTWSNSGDRVLDPFFGSGNFLLTALALNRQPIGCEIDTEAFKSVIGRYNTYYGR